MRQYPGEISEVWLAGDSGQVAGRITCPDGGAPAAGQFVLADAEGDATSALATVLFAGGFPLEGGGWIAAPPLPAHWLPGTPLRLLGPIGRGFGLPAASSRVALAAFGESPARLLPLAAQALARGAGVALLFDLSRHAGALRDLPPAVEAAPLDALNDLLNWMDFLAIDIPAGRLGNLRAAAGLNAGQGFPCPAQALVTVAMPCAGLGECGACAVRARYGWRLACKDGPVFDLKELAW
jgi:dihydroorotate dehydrogenase electron transfer subunit